MYLDDINLRLSPQLHWKIVMIHSTVRCISLRRPSGRKTRLEASDSALIAERAARYDDRQCSKKPDSSEGSDVLKFTARRFSL